MLYEDVATLVEYISHAMSDATIEAAVLLLEIFEVAELAQLFFLEVMGSTFFVE